MIGFIIAIVMGGIIGWLASKVGTSKNPLAKGGLI